MLGLFFIRRKVNCTQRRRVLFTSEYYALYSGSLDWGRIFSRKIRHQFSLTYLTAFCLSCFKGLHLVLWILIAYYLYSFRILPPASRPVRKQLFHVITINVETGFAYTDGYWTNGGNLPRNALGDGLFILAEHCLWLREGRDILRLLNTFKTITSHRNLAPM